MIAALVTIAIPTVAGALLFALAIAVSCPVYRYQDGQQGESV